MKKKSTEESGSEEEAGAAGAAGAAGGAVTPAEGLATPLGISSVPPGVETPDTIELRKKKLDSDIEG